MTDYKRIHITIEGLEEGPFEITTNRIESKNGQITTITDSYTTDNFTLDHKEKKKNNELIQH